MNLYEAYQKAYVKYGELDALVCEHKEEILEKSTLLAEMDKDNQEDLTKKITEATSRTTRIWAVISVATSIVVAVVFFLLGRAF